MKLTEFDGLVHAFKTKPLEDETEELQEAIWACNDFAEEKIKEKLRSYKTGILQDRLTLRNNWHLTALALC